nr:MFS transporter [Actinomycetales bacterium]
METTPTWRYAIGMFGMSLPINMIRGSMALYWIDIQGLNAGAYAIVMAVYGIIDAIDNPVLGFLSDRTRTRFGRRKPWLVVGITVLAAAFVALFSAPTSLEGAQMVAWFAIFAILCEAADSMIAANYGALLPELFPEERRRAHANSMRQGFQLVALIISLALTPVLTTRVFGTDRTTEGFSTTAIIYAVVAAAVLLFMTFSVREVPPATSEHQPGFFSSIADIVATRTFWQVGIASACYLVPLGIVLAAMQLYVKYTLDLPVDRTFVIMGVVVVFAILGIAGWTRAVTRWGAPRVWRIGYLFLAAGFIPLYFATSLVGAVLAGLVIAVGWSALLATNDLIQARILDDDARRHGVHREGIFLSAFGFFGRLTGALTGFGFWLISVMYGYQNQDVPGDDPAGAFRFLMCVIPFVIAALGAVISRLIHVPEAGRTYDREEVSLP